MHRWTLFKRGMKDGIPVILGYIPIGIAYGMMAVNAHVSIPATLSLSLFVYTGAGQMAGINMMGQHATILAIVCTTFIMNLRHCRSLLPMKSLPSILQSLNQSIISATFLA